MPDGPRYEDDFYAWTQYQAQVLRTLRTRDNRFDRDHLAEEIDDLGRSERNAVRSQVRGILVHFLKLAYSPAHDPRFDWLDSIIEARAALEDQLSPSLRRDINETLPRLYSAARKQAALELHRGPAKEQRWRSHPQPVLRHTSARFFTSAAPGPVAAICAPGDGHGLIGTARQAWP